MERYLNAVSKDEQDLIKPVYFKTGYVFSDERDALKKNNYSVFEAEDLKNFLDGQVATKKNEIMRQYAEYLTDQIKSRDEAIAKWDLNHDHVQWEFMLKLRETLEGAASDFSGCGNGLQRGKNRGGSPWTQYWFSNHLFWRIDKGKPLRLMNVLYDVGLDYDEVQEEYRSRFKEALSEGGLSPGKIRLVRAKYQCTTGSIETDKISEMTVSKFLDGVKRVHIGFLERMQQSV